MALLSSAQPPAGVERRDPTHPVPARKRARGGGYRGLAWIIVLSSCWWTLRAADSSKEYALKAAFLYHFTQFVEWPAQAFGTTNAPFIIGVLGHNPFGSALEEVVQNETVQGRRLQVQYFSRVEEIGNCHILYLGHAAAAEAGAMARFSSRPMLTVGETESFVVRGGILRFISERGRVRFQINVNAAREAGLTISSKLLRLADVYPPSS